MIEIPARVVMIKGFEKCDKLNEIVFEPGSQVRQIEGFMYCKTLYKIEIPASAVNIAGFGHSGVRQLRFANGTMIERIKKRFERRERQLRFPNVEESPGFFVEFEESNLKKGRRRVHMRCGRQ
jgi:hypothetical protein